MLKQEVGSTWQNRTLSLRPIARVKGQTKSPALCTYFFFIFSFIFISWRLITLQYFTLQYCSGFRHTLAWISHGFTCVARPDPHSQVSCFKPWPLKGSAWPSASWKKQRETSAGVSSSKGGSQEAHGGARWASNQRWPNSKGKSHHKKEKAEATSNAFALLGFGYWNY